MPISSLVLKFGISFLLLGCRSVEATSLYMLQDNYEGTSFFDEFEFFTVGSLHSAF